ncbi:MAG: hypothetical protein Q9198_001552 [Flavoplaca austrocitrina]
MAFPQNSLRAFLRYAKRGLFTAIQSSGRVTIVVGNESADLDSLTSSVLYSYVRSLAPPSGAFTPLYIPLLNIRAADIRLRPEFEAVFRHANIDASHLVTLEDLPEANESPLDPKDVTFVLVDHNRLQGELSKKYAARVRGIVDHHEDEGAFCSETSPEPRIIEKCGSCTSLVVRTIISSWESIAGGSSFASGASHAQGDSSVNDESMTRTWNAQIAKMALASILIDTANLTAEDKVEEADVEAVKYLESKIKLSPQDAAQWDRDKFYKSIDYAKRNIDAMDFEDILRKGYKQWTEKGLNLGVSSVVKPLDFLIKKLGGDLSEDKQQLFVSSIGDFMATRRLTIFAIMTTFTSKSGEFQRELYVQALSSGYAAAHVFAEQAKVELRIEDHDVASCKELGSVKPLDQGPWYAPLPPLCGPYSTSDDFHSKVDHVNRRKVWLQRDVSKSRKQVAPLMRKAMREAA